MDNKMPNNALKETKLNSELTKRNNLLTTISILITFVSMGISIYAFYKASTAEKETEKIRAQYIIQNNQITKINKSIINLNKTVELIGQQNNVTGSVKYFQPTQ